jgi:hypothetical protein
MCKIIGCRRRWSLTERERHIMLKRDMLQAVLLKISDTEFNTVWKDTYGDVPSGKRSDLVRDFVAEQYDKELDDCIQRVESLLNPIPKPKKVINRWLCPR